MHNTIAAVVQKSDVTTTVIVWLTLQPLCADVQYTLMARYILQPLQLDADYRNITTIAAPQIKIWKMYLHNAYYIHYHCSCTPHKHHKYCPCAICITATTAAQFILHPLRLCRTHSEHFIYHICILNSPTHNAVAQWHHKMPQCHKCACIVASCISRWCIIITFWHY
jgi:hypothetical protein